MDKIDFGCLEDSGEEILIDGGDSNVSEEDQYFDEIVGALENILMLEEFNDLQNDFCEQHCEVFEDTEESKLVYTDLFSQYTELIEGYIIGRLTLEIDDFSKDKFGALLADRQDEITGDNQGEGFSGGIDGCLGIVSKENFAVGGTGGGLEASPMKMAAAGRKDVLSPASREAKDAGLSP
ncbi:hypothetical protein TrLO_g3230 [Triparma laevis f. longispina]|uniref:ADP-ribosylation factor-like protein 2-binding protein n=1 Tax=Triparma laevis f. longispina TaxID=1714387 RepID=A0A9W7A247_9STRA|nr:hypothetical protein TrLO_g3230 [Triparma laevis f. longispina]